MDETAAPAGDRWRLLVDEQGVGQLYRTYLPTTEDPSGWRRTDPVADRGLGSEATPPIRRGGYHDVHLMGVLRDEWAAMDCCPEHVMSS